MDSGPLWTESNYRQPGTGEERKSSATARLRGVRCTVWFDFFCSTDCLRFDRCPPNDYHRIRVRSHQLIVRSLLLPELETLSDGSLGIQLARVSGDGELGLLLC